MSPNPLRAARGTTAAISARILKDGELAYNTDTDRLHVGDGTTLGGKVIVPENAEGDVETRLDALEDTVAAPSAFQVTATDQATARSLANWFQGYARGSEAPDTAGHFTDKGGVLLHRFRDRVFVADFNDNDGSTDGASGQTWIADESLGDWIERSSSLGVHSPIGGIAVHGASRVSDRYKVNGTQVTVWASGQSIGAAGVYRAYQGKIYISTGAGTTSSTPPTHTSGTQSDGAVSWTFVDYAYGAPIGIQGLTVYDTTPDGQAAWAAHFLAVRKSGAGTVAGMEVGALNRGADVTNTPYSISPEGSTIGLWLQAGYDVLASVNPATAALVIGSNDTSWNSGIVFESDGITSGGYSMKLAAITAHQIGWFNSSGQQVSVMRSAGTANNERTQLLFGDRKIEFYAVGGVMFTAQSGASAGVAADEHINLLAYAAGTGYAEVRPHGTASNLDLLLSGRGTGIVRTAGNFYAQTNKPISYPLAKSAVAASHTGDTNETTLATVQIPAGAMGPNGFVRITTTWSHTSSGNNKNLIVRFGGTGGTTYQNSTVTATASTRHQILIGNRNSASSQVGMTATTAGGFGSTNAAVATSSANTTSAVDIVFRCLLANSGETITLESYLVEIFYGA